MICTAPCIVPNLLAPDQHLRPGPTVPPPNFFGFVQQRRANRATSRSCPSPACLSRSPDKALHHRQRARPCPRSRRGLFAIAQEQPRCLPCPLQTEPAAEEANRPH